MGALDIELPFTLGPLWSKRSPAANTYDRIVNYRLFFSYEPMSDDVNCQTVNCLSFSAFIGYSKEFLYQQSFSQFSDVVL